jgi:hypothetical protein
VPTRPQAARQGALARLLRSAGNTAMRRVVTPTIQRQQTREQRLLNLESPRFKGDRTLEGVFDGFIELRKPLRNSPAVRKVQQALIDAGFPLPRCGADGNFGDETEAAVKAFQRAAGLEDAQIDGIVGENTLSRLDARFTEGSAIVPERRCELGFRTIKVDAAIFHGFTDSAQSFIDHANEVFKTCCIAFSMGAPVTLDETRTRGLLGGGTTYVAGDCATRSAHDSSVLADPAISRMSKPFKVLFVARLEDPSGRQRGLSNSPSCARLGRGMAGFFHVAQGADLRTMAHEFAHYLMSVFAEHSVQTSNIQHISTGATGDQITPLQCDIMYTRALDESVI